MPCKKPCEAWKNEIAKGIAVDEAGNINHPDLYSVWGNTLLPCFSPAMTSNCPLLS